MNIELPDINTAEGGLSFLFGVIFNQTIRSEAAWRAPLGLHKRLGHLDVFKLADMEPGELADVIAERPVLHPFSSAMGRNIVGASQLLREEYDGDAAKVWDDKPTAKKLLDRLVSFPGIGKHKADVALFLLSCEYGVPVEEDGTPLDAALSHCPRLAELFRY